MIVFKKSKFLFFEFAGNTSRIAYVSCENTYFFYTRFFFEFFKPIELLRSLRKILALNTHNHIKYIPQAIIKQ